MKAFATSVRRTGLKDKLIYWSATGIVVFIMLFSIYKLFSPEYAHLGFPDYFRNELAVLKVLGIMALVVPQVPERLKDWAYAGFFFNLLSASVAHFNSGDELFLVINPFFYMVPLLLSSYYMHKLIKTAADRV